MAAAPPEPTAAPALLSKRAVVGLALLGAGLVLLSATRTWVTAAVPDLPAADVGVSGRQAAPVVVAVALAAAAAAVVLATSGRAVRLVAALALVAAGAGVVVATLAVVRDPAAAVRPAVTQATGVTGAATGPAELSFWPWPTLAGGVALVLAGAAGAAGGRRWPAPGSRFEREDPASAGGAAAADDTATWDALSRGEDPT